MLDINRVYNQCCLEGMKLIDYKSVDMILCDLPYQMTKCHWDSLIPFEPLWEQYERIIKDNGAIVLFGSEPFSSKLRLSNIELYKYDWYWNKSKANGFLNVKKMPLKSIETISVFYKSLPTYNPQGIKPYGKEIINPKGKLDNTKHVSGHNGGAIKTDKYTREFTGYPRQILEFSTVAKPIHNTQKPVALLEYLINTYTNPNELVLDNTIGSGSTIIAAINTNRNYIGFELDENYYNLATDRINKHLDGIGKLNNSNKQIII